MKRHKSEWARAYHSKERVEFVKSLPCKACGATPCENAHTFVGGVGRKGDALTVIPLCRSCHRKQHGHGWLALFDMERDDVRHWLAEFAAETQAAWLAHQEAV